MHHIIWQVIYEYLTSTKKLMCFYMRCDNYFKGNFVQVIHVQFYKMIGRIIYVIVVLFPALVAGKPRDPAFRLLPYRYKPVYNVLVAAKEMDCKARATCL